MQDTLNLMSERLRADELARTPARRQVAYAAGSALVTLLLGCSLTIDLLTRHNTTAALLVSGATTLGAASAAVISLRLALARRHARLSGTQNTRTNDDQDASDQPEAPAP